MTTIDEARAGAGLTPKACATDCPCPCHGDDENPGPHVSACALSDPNFDDGAFSILPAPGDDVVAIALTRIPVRRTTFDPLAAMNGYAPQKKGRP